MKRLPLSEARDRLSSLVNEVAHGNRRIIIESHGRAKAAIVGMRDLELIESAASGDDSESASMLRWLEDADRNMVAARAPADASLDALREVREMSVAEDAGLYRRQRRPQARRRRRR